MLGQWIFRSLRPFVFRGARAVMICLLAAGGLGACAAEAEPPEDDAPLVIVAAPIAAEGSREVTLPGSFEPYERAMLYAKVTGYVSVVNVDIGDEIEKGAPLIQLHLPETEARLREAEASAGLARVTSRRLSDLRAEEPMAVTEQNVDVAAAQAKAAAAKVEHLKAMMAYSVIRAPFDGMVARRLVDPGALVVEGAEGGDPVLEFARADRLRLVMAIPEAIVPQVKPGVKALITVDALPGKSFEGSIARVAGALSQETRSMRAEIDMDSEGGVLRPGMYATVRLHLKGDSGGLALPASVILRESKNAFVWTVEEGTLMKTPVEIASDDGDRVVIKAGLDPTTRVVIEGPQNLRAGQAVRVEEKGNVR